MQTGALTLEQVGIGTLGGVALRIEPGRVTCLSGPSGSGKSRLLRAVADLEPHDGTIALGATRQTDVPANQWRRSVMLVPADSQWWHEGVAEHFGRPMPEALEALGFEQAAADWPVSRLSTGEKQRMALIRALSYSPLALLLDEPTANLDGETGRRVEGWVRELARTEGMPVLWVAHDPDQIRRVADHYYRITGDRLEAVT